MIYMQERFKNLNKSRKVMGSDNNAFPLPNIKGEDSIYEDLAKKGFK